MTTELQPIGPGSTGFDDTRIVPEPSVGFLLFAGLSIAWTTFAIWCWLNKDDSHRDTSNKWHAQRHCPQCDAHTVDANLGDGTVDTYCEECGWPDENRKESGDE